MGISQTEVFCLPGNELSAYLTYLLPFLLLDPQVATAAPQKDNRTGLQALGLCPHLPRYRAVFGPPFPHMESETRNEA